MASLDWQPAGRGSGYVFKQGQNFRFQRGGFSSDVFTSLAEANRQGWAQYREWCKQLPKGIKRPHADPATAKKQAVPAVARKRNPPGLDACSRDQQVEQQQQWHTSAGSPAAEAAATEVSTLAMHRTKKKRTANTPAAAPRSKRRTAAAAAAARPAARPPWAHAPAAAAPAPPEEGAGSNCASPASKAALAPALAASTAFDPFFPSSMTVWKPGNSTESNKRLQLRFEVTLGRGGFGEVHKVSVKAHGPNSLSTLKLRGNAGAAIRQLLALTDCASMASSSRSSRDKAPSGSSSSIAGSSNSITMALKLAPPFIFTSWEMQQNYNHDALRYNEHVKQRMLAEFNVMRSCAASPHVVDAFIAGSVSHYGTCLPAFLMEFAPHGDVEQAFLAQRLRDPWGLAGQQQYASACVLPGQPPPQQQQEGIPRGLSSTVTQRIVRAAAMGLRDLHAMAGHLHCDIKTTNLLVFGDADNPIIKICDLGVCKRRSELTRGPVSGTKDWQAPEQAHAGGGPLDFCLDSWGLGLLVLGLRRGRRPFWWLQDVGVTPAEFATSLAVSLGRPDSQYAQADANQAGAPLGPLEVAFVQCCMAHSSIRQPPQLLLQSDPYLSGRYRGG